MMMMMDLVVVAAAVDGRVVAVDRAVTLDGRVVDTQRRVVHVDPVAFGRRARERRRRGEDLAQTRVPQLQDGPDARRVGPADIRDHLQQRSDDNHARASY